MNFAFESHKVDEQTARKTQFGVSNVVIRNKKNIVNQRRSRDFGRLRKK